MSDSFKIQQNVKVNNDLINLRADNADEFKQIAEWVVANAALFVNVQAALNGVPPALAANVAHTQVQQEAPPQQQYQDPAPSPWSQPQQAPPQYAQQAPTNGPTCMHGAMVHRSGTKNGRDWSGYFCPTPKGTPNQCQPQFGK